jgi:DNA-binding MarR family transcriptional regulator
MAIAKSPLQRDILKLKVERDDGIYRLDNYQISDSIGYLMKRCTLMTTAAIDQELAPYDLTHPQFSILMMLKERNCNTAADLARETCNDTGAVTRMLDRLEAKDIVRRVRSSEDRRIVNIELTDLGKLVIEKMPVVAINVMNRYLSNFSQTEIAQLKNLLRKLIQSGSEELAKAQAGKEKKA